MRQTIRLEVGVGWQLRGREVEGIEKTQVTYQYPQELGKKILVSFLPTGQVATKARLLTAVAELKRLMEERNLSLKEAENSCWNMPAKYQTPTITNCKISLRLLLNQETTEEGQRLET